MTASLIFVVIGVVWLSTSIETFDEVAKLLGAEERKYWNPLFPEYTIPGLEGNMGATLIFNIIMMLGVLALAYAVSRLLITRRRKG
jgi:ABC-type uncharacterized transport system permease subunit